MYFSTHVDVLWSCLRRFEPFKKKHDPALWGHVTCYIFKILESTAPFVIVVPTVPIVIVTPSAMSTGPVAFATDIAVKKAQVAALAVAERCATEAAKQKADKDYYDVACAIARAPDNQKILAQGYFASTFGQFIVQP